MAEGMDWVAAFRREHGGREPSLEDLVAKKESEEYVQKTGGGLPPGWWEWNYATRVKPDEELMALKDVPYQAFPGGFQGDIPQPWAMSESSRPAQVRRWTDMLTALRMGMQPGGPQWQEYFGPQDESLGAMSPAWLQSNLNQLMQANKPLAYNFPAERRGELEKGLPYTPVEGEPAWYARVRAIQEWLNNEAVAKGATAPSGGEGATAPSGGEGATAKRELTPREQIGAMEGASWDPALQARLASLYKPGTVKPLPSPAPATIPRRVTPAVPRGRPLESYFAEGGDVLRRLLTEPGYLADLLGGIIGPPPR